MIHKVDLHTHSDASPDGGITLAQYQKALQSGHLDYIAVTDHNRIDGALAIQQVLGDKIIVGEEIMTMSGEIIGLFLTELVPSGLTPIETVRLIKEQHGLVYIPHPFETVRKGLHPGILEELSPYIDILEVCNGRVFLQNRSAQAVVWARLNHVVSAASSDAHGYHGLGKTYTCVNEPPTADNLIHLLTTASTITARPRTRSLLYPKYHRLRRKLRGQG
jgi:predicted metal-dependent phosphoesterase TrpH